MNKMELISALKTEANLSKAEAARVVQIFFDHMAEGLARGERVEIRGLVQLLRQGPTRATPAGTPRPVKKWQSNLRDLPFFKAGKEIKERVDL